MLCTHQTQNCTGWARSLPVFGGDQGGLAGMGMRGWSRAGQPGPGAAFQAGTSQRRGAGCCAGALGAGMGAGSLQGLAGLWEISSCCCCWGRGSSSGARAEMVAGIPWQRSDPGHLAPSRTVPEPPQGAGRGQQLRVTPRAGCPGASGSARSCCWGRASGGASLRDTLLLQGQTFWPAMPPPAPAPGSPPCS